MSWSVAHQHDEAPRQMFPRSRESVAPCPVYNILHTATWHAFTLADEAGLYSRRGRPLLAVAVVAADGLLPIAASRAHLQRAGRTDKEDND